MDDFVLNSLLDATLKSMDWITKTESAWVEPPLTTNPSDRSIVELTLLSNVNGVGFFFGFFVLNIYTCVYIFCQPVLFQTHFVDSKYVMENMYPEV